MRCLLVLMKKEFLQVSRDRAMMAIIFVMPLIQLFVLGYAVSVDIERIPTALWDLDRSRESRELVGELRHSRLLAVELRPEGRASVREWLDSGRARIAIVIPRHFGRDLAVLRSPQIELVADGQDARNAAVGLGYARGIIADFGLEAIRRRSPDPLVQSVEPSVRVWYNPDLENTNFMVPGIVALLLTVITTVLTALGTVREKEIGTLEQLLVTPVRPWQLVLGKTLPFALLGFLELAIAMSVGVLWYRIPVAGSFVLLFAFAALYLPTILGLGLLVSSISKSQQQALFIAWFFIILLIMLSGFFSPIRNMARPIQLLTYLNPLRFFMTAVREIILKGAGLGSLWREALALALFGLGMMGLNVVVARLTRARG